MKTVREDIEEIHTNTATQMIFEIKITPYFGIETMCFLCEQRIKFFRHSALVVAKQMCNRIDAITG